MARIKQDHRLMRLKWNLYFAILALLAALGSCVVCTNYVEWSGVQHKALRETLQSLEQDVLLRNLSHEQRVKQLWGECNKALRGRWMVGYFIDPVGHGSFCGRPAGDFARAVKANEKAILADDFDPDSLPRYLLTIKFDRLNCRLLVGSSLGPNETPQEDPREVW
jgi:hypothetical protein